MSLTGFLFGNVDEDGKLSDTELDDELRDTLGGEGASNYLTGILGSSLFNDAPEKPTSKQTAAAAPKDGLASIQPHADAVDFSDFNELAEDAAVPKKWRADMLPPQLPMSVRPQATVARAEVDDDYDSEEGDAQGDVALMESDAESLEDLFDSPANPPAQSTEKEEDGKEEDEKMEQTPEQVASEESTVEASETPAEPAPAVVPRVVKRIAPGPLQFTDLFGCHIIKHIKKPRRPAASSSADQQQQPLVPQRPALDTRKLLAADSVVERPRDFLRQVISQSIAADENSRVYVTIDSDTGQVTSQKTGPRQHVDQASHLFEAMPYPLDLEDWESQVIWQEFETASTAAGPVDVREIMLRPKNNLIEEYESHIIWDPEEPFAPCSQLQINMNDTHMLFEDANSIKESNAREAERLRLLEGVDQFNLSNDHFYEALQEGKVHRVRQTFGQLVIAHSLPALRLQPPYFKMRLARNDLRSWHRPFLQAPIDKTVTFARVRTAKKRKQKHSMENPWAAKDITLKDTADCVLVEYSEEYPLVLSNVGMGSVFVNYYRKRGMNDKSFPKVDLGELFILDVADVSPFLNFGNVEPGQVIPALYNNMFRAPLFSHKVRATDFLVVKHVSKGESKWYVRGIQYQYLVGQTYPLQEVPAPHSRKVTTTIKHRLQVAAYRLMNRNQYHLLQMGKLARLFPEYSDLQIRQRLKEFCEYQRKGLGAGYWRPKHNMPIPEEENLRKMLTPEMLCVFESMRVGQQQLHDAGKLGEEEEDNDEGGESKLSIEELLAPWNLTRNFINATQGKAMLKLYGEGDPTGKGDGFSFVRVSMKDIFLRAGESVQEKLAEIEARPKSAHRYNVAEQQQIYKEEIMRIWKTQFAELASPQPPPTLQREAYKDANVVVPEINDMFGDSAYGQDVSAVTPSRMVPGSAMDVSQKLSQALGSTQTASHANFVQPNRKSLTIRRAVKSPYTGELMWRTEVIKDSAVIQAYLRQRRIIENAAHDRESQFDDDDLFSSGSATVDLASETRAHLARLKRARERRIEDGRTHEKSHMTTFSLPQPNKPKKEVIRRCGNCGELGHMKTNKKCPRYYEFNPA